MTLEALEKKFSTVHLVQPPASRYIWCNRRRHGLTSFQTSASECAWSKAIASRGASRTAFVPLLINITISKGTNRAWPQRGSGKGNNAAKL